MQIKSPTPIAADRSAPRGNTAAKTPVETGAFTRKPANGIPASTTKTGETSATQHASSVSAVGPTPLKPLATKLCEACAGLQDSLIKSGAKNPTHLGNDLGGVVFRNQANGEVGVRHLHVKSGFFNLKNFDTTCLVKSDGRVIFNGKTLTEGDPELPGIKKALESILEQVSSNTLRRSSVISYANDEPWNPKSLGFEDYVA